MNLVYSRMSSDELELYTDTAGSSGFNKYMVRGPLAGWLKV